VMGDAAANPSFGGGVSAQHREESRLVFAHDLGVDGSGQRWFVREMVIHRPDADIGVTPDLVERRRDGAVGRKPAAGHLQQAPPRARTIGTWHEKDSTATEESSVNERWQSTE